MPGQLAKDLIGTWVLVGSADEIAGSRLKLLTGGYWTITEADPNTGLTIYHHGGTYTLEGDKYTETVEYANPSTSNLIGQSFQFAIKIDGDTLTQTGIGNPWTEKWKRAVPKSTMTKIEPKVVTVQVESAGGSPLPNVAVVCVDATTNAWLEGTTIKGGSRTLHADETGRFMFDAGRQNIFFMIATETGFGLGQSRFLIGDPVLVVEPWGRIEGTRINRDRPVANQRLMLGLDYRCLSDEISTRDRVGMDDKTTTDSVGRFVFTHVPPIGLRLYEVEQSKELWDVVGHFNVRPGQIKQLQVVTNGRTVTGLLEPADGLPVDLDLKSCDLYLRIASHQRGFIPATPKEFDTPQKRTGWWEDWYESEQGQITFPPGNKGRIGSGLSVQSNGWFTSDIAVAPGRYWANGFIEKDGKKVAKVDQYVDIPGGNEDTDSPYDLGKVILKPCLQVGDMAPDVTTKTLDDKPLKLSDFHGKYVLLDFWATWCGPCRAEMPNLKNVYQSFGNDQRFAMISLSLDSDRSQPKGYVEANKVGWEQVFLGDWNLDSVTKAFEVDSIPSIWLIGPDGKIIARGLRGSKIKETVAAALGNAEKE